MIEKKDLRDVNTIGTDASPVDTIFVKRILGCENFSYKPPIITISPDDEIFQGMITDKTGNTFEFKTTTHHDANINLKTHYLNGNGTNAGLRFPGGGINGEFTNRLTVKGQINADRTGEHSLVAAESIRVEGSYYTGEDQGVTASEPFVADLRISGGVLQYRTGTIEIKGGNTIYLLSTPTWISVPTI